MCSVFILIRCHFFPSSDGHTAMWMMAAQGLCMYEDHVAGGLGLTPLGYHTDFSNPYPPTCYCISDL